MGITTLKEITECFNKEGYTLLTKEYKNQQQRLDYLCPNGHKRSTTWKNWKKGSRCLICKNQRTKLSIEAVSKAFEEEGYTLLSKKYVNSKTKLDYMCSNEHKNSITWADWNCGGYRCPDCANNKKLTITYIKKTFEEEGYTLLSTVYENNTTPLKVTCPKGHMFVTRRVDWTSGRRCPVCYSERVNIESVRGSFMAEGYTLLTDTYIDAHSKLNYVCPVGHNHSISWASWQQGRRCYHCRNLKHRLPIKEIKTMFALEDYIFIEGSYLKNKLEYICPKSHEGSVSLGNWKTNGVRCIVCGNNGTSTQEQSLIAYVKSLNIKVVVHDRLIIGPKELDIVIPSKKIAIEYCGLYWHSELMDKNNDYHLDKLESCNRKGHSLITIFEDEWVNKRDIVMSRLKSVLNIKENVAVVYARNCTIKPINTKEARLFCEENHLQGYTGSSIKLGAFYQDELVSVMTFSKPSLSKGAKNSKEGVFELSRFCSKLNTSVVGGASKLLSYFRNNYVWNQIFSYADRRWSNGNLYEKIGFSFDSSTQPNYWYFVKGDITRLHRFALRKRYEEPKSKTEWELRQAQGLNRVWDCGNLKYTITNK
jgi:hypothetical protein